MQAIPITTRSSVRRNLQQFTDFFKSVLVPDFQHDSLPLLGGEVLQSPHSFRFRRTLPAGRLKPPLRFPFARQPAPETSAVVQRAVAKSPDTVVVWLARRLGALHQGDKGLLQNVFGFGMA